MTSSRTLLLIIIVCFFLGSAGCTAVQEPVVELEPTATPIIIPTSELKDRTLTLFWWLTPNAVNPHLTSATADRDVARPIYEPLASFNAEGELVPILAKTIPNIEDGSLDPDLRWVRWTLQDDLKWSDGKSVTAHDVKFTYDFIKENEAATATAYNAVESVEVLDLNTIQVNFSDTNPAWALPFVGIEGLILPGHIYAGTTVDEEVEPVGTGPYKLVSTSAEEVLFLGNELVTTVRFIYEVNPYYRNVDDLYFTKIELRGGGTALEAASSVLQFGDVDFGYNLQIEGDVLTEMVELGNGTGRLVGSLGGRVEQIAISRTDPNDTSYESPHSFLSIEVDETNENVLKAIAYAIDKKTISNLYGPLGEEANAILMAPANFRSDQNFYEYDLETAKRLLTQAGWVDENGDGVLEKDGRDLSVTLRTNSNSLRQETQRIIKESLEEIGIEVNLEVSGQYFSTDVNLANTLWAGTADFLMYTNGNQTPDPGSYMREWTCGRAPQNQDGNWSGVNVARWCSEEYDELYNQAIIETDPERREQLFKQMSDMLVENVVVIPLISRTRMSGVSNEIEGVELTPWDSHLWNVHEWRRVP